MIGFPLGGNTSSSKVFEANECKKNGCDEVDMVMSLPSFKSKKYEFVKEEIAQIVKTIHPLPLKVIIENSLLKHEEKIKACELCLESGAHFVKTSTGFSSGVATVEDVKLMRSVVGSKMKIKASGGVRSSADALNLIQAGADTIGTSWGKDIVTGKISQQGGY